MTYSVDTCTVTTITNTLRNRQKNPDIRDKCQTDDIVIWARKRKGRNPQVDKMTPDTMAKLVRNNNLIGRKLLNRWKDSWQSTL